jgi:eukaryotic translation initiation factor 2C
MNCDADANRFAAVCETNGYRTEMITPNNMQNMFTQLLNYWKPNHAGPPVHIMYFRDGVAEGQFAQVMDIEIAELRRFFANKGLAPKFTVIVATKRHHIRLFPPTGGDKNANPLPGTLVEKEVTHPFMWDFYLNSHVAIQGTARPVHYYVLQDEMGIPVNDLQKMIYYQCYSYARSTTPVSLHPAVYYAHLAADRARAHETVPSTDGFRAGGKGHEVHIDKAAKGLTVPGSMAGIDALPLLPLGGISGKEKPAVSGEDRQRAAFRSAMWFI